MFAKWVLMLGMLVLIVANASAVNTVQAMPYDNEVTLASTPNTTTMEAGPSAQKKTIVQKAAPQATTLTTLKGDVADLKALQATDKRVKILQQYLSRYNSPLKDEAKHFVAAADKYELDWRLVAAIAGVESTFGKFVPGGPEDGSYNAWGWGVYGTQAIYFDSWKEGIYTVSEGLKKNYVSRGLNDPYAINQMYSASPAWGSKVTYFLEDINEFEEQYKESDLTQAIPSTNINTSASSALLAFKP